MKLKHLLTISLLAVTSLSAMAEQTIVCDNGNLSITFDDKKIRNTKIPWGKKNVMVEEAYNSDFQDKILGIHGRLTDIQKSRKAVLLQRDQNFSHDISAITFPIKLLGKEGSFKTKYSFYYYQGNINPEDYQNYPDHVDVRIEEENFEWSEKPQFDAYLSTKLYEVECTSIVQK